jgi:cyclophilin family peptidyl-prolyl cis-trans isomerase/outer membrane murein-binding lipoprotein Lpp
MRTGISSLLLVFAAALALVAVAGCGSSKKSDNASGAISTPATTDTTASTPDTTATTSTTSQSGPCKTVSQPSPKSTQLPKPTLKLDPSKTWTATVATNCGSFTIKLDVKRAPKTSASFVYLARKGFYDDLPFHRIVPGFVIQGGDPEGSGNGGPGYQVVEAPPRNLQYRHGIVAMAKTGTDPDGASGSQFFVMTADNQLPPQYALLGKVTKGLDVVDTIGDVPLQSANDPQGGPPASPVVISKVTVKSS